jgi:hypothetical protein
MTEGEIISLLQTRMDKCTAEQFWAVGIITGLSVFLLSKRSIIRKIKLNKHIIAAHVFLSAYGIYFVVHRHVSWFRLECELRNLLKYEIFAPEILKEKIVCGDINVLSGVVFYTVWILLTCAGVIKCYLPSKNSEEKPQTSKVQPESSEEKSPK